MEHLNNKWQQQGRDKKKTMMIILLLVIGLATEAKLKPKPNILLLFPDQWRWDWTELNPNLDIHTPNTATLAASGTYVLPFLPSDTASFLCMMVCMACFEMSRR